MHTKRGVGRAIKFVTGVPVEQIAKPTPKEWAMILSYAAYMIVMCAVIGAAADNTTNLFWQTTFWNLEFKKFFRKFTDPNCDRSVSGCPSTIEFVTPQSEISGVTVFMWILVAPIVAFAYAFLRMIKWRTLKEAMDLYRFRMHDEVFVTLLIVAELFLLTYLRASGGENSLASLLSFCGCWVALRYSEMVNSTVAFAIDLLRFRERKAEKDDPVLSILDPFTNPNVLEVAFHVVLRLAPYALIWASFFLPIGTAMGNNGNTRYSYVLAHFLFFAFHALENDYVVRSAYTFFGGNKASVGTADAIETFDAFTKKYYRNVHVTRVTFWLAKMMSSSLVLYTCDVATRSPVVQFNLGA